jgi:hypothetical protein
MQKLKKSLTGRSEILDRTGPDLAGPAGYRYRLQLWDRHLDLYALHP